MKVRASLREFIEAYDADWRARWGVSSEGTDASEIDELAEAARVHQPGLSRGDIKVLESKGLNLPDAPREFLEEVSCSAWELPWRIHLLSTDGPISELSSWMQSQPDKSLCTIGEVENAGAALCLRLTGTRTEDTSIWAAQEARGEPRVMGPVFSSFDKMLAVLAAALRGGVNTDLKRRDPDAYEQLLKQLRAIDPQGFGGEAWTFWQSYV